MSMAMDNNNHIRRHDNHHGTRQQQQQQQPRRRRPLDVVLPHPHPNTAANGVSALVVIDGGTAYDEESNNPPNPKRRQPPPRSSRRLAQQQQQQQQRGRTRRRKRRNSKKQWSSDDDDDKNDKDEPFVYLFGRVAMTTLALLVMIMMFVKGGTSIVQRYFYKSTPTQFQPGDDDDLVVAAEQQPIVRPIPLPIQTTSNIRAPHAAAPVAATTTTTLRVRSPQEREDEDDPKAAILRMQQQRQQQHVNPDDSSQRQDSTPLPNPESPEMLPSWKLTDRARQWDAYALAEQQNQNQQQSSKQALFWQTAAKLRTRFAEQYAPNANTTIARALVEQSLTTMTTTSRNHSSLPPYDLFQTACRMRRARHASRPFTMAFAGYSVTTGRGNYFHQAYPNVLESLLRPAFQHLNMSLQVRNAAIGGCPSFPYGWCLANFLGGTNEPRNVVDVVSWDFRMNEAGGNPVGLEAYLRHVASSWQSPPPQLLVHDTHTALPRQELLQQYATGSFPFPWRDSVILHTDVTVRPWLLLRSESERPVGFRAWRQFGAPLHAPGQSAHHPAVAEHLFLAWILALHWLNALQLVALVDDDDESDDSNSTSRSSWKHDLEEYCRDYDRATRDRSSRRWLPQPVYQGFNYSEPWTSILFGQPVESSAINRDNNNNDASSKSSLWKMNAVHCRTSFAPIVYGNLSDIIVSGTAAQDLDVLLPKSNQFYHGHWVWDMSDAEKLAKRQLDRYGGLGFVDRKPAYYGIYPSGTLTLWLPFEPDFQGPGARPQLHDSASNWFRSVVVCQVNEGPSQHHRPNTGGGGGGGGGDATCETWRDVQFAMDGVPVPSVTNLQAPGTVYLGRPLCAHLTIPATARLTARPRNDNNNNISSASLEAPSPGLLVTATVHNSHIVQRDQACSISHVVWEQRDQADDVDKSLVL